MSSPTRIDTARIRNGSSGKKLVEDVPVS